MRKIRRSVFAYMRAVASLWISLAGFVMISAGVCLVSLPCGLVVGGICAVLFEWRVDLELKEART